MNIIILINTGTSLHLQRGIFVWGMKSTSSNFSHHRSENDKVRRPLSHHRFQNEGGGPIFYILFLQSVQNTVQIGRSEGVVVQSVAGAARFAPDHAPVVRANWDVDA